MFRWPNGWLIEDPRCQALNPDNEGLAARLREDVRLSDEAHDRAKPAHGRTEVGPELLRHPMDLVSLAATSVSVLAQHSCLDSDVAGPVLRVDHEHPAWPVDEVVDVRFARPWPAHVVDDGKPGRRKTEQRGGDRQLADTALLELLGSLFQSIRAAPQFIARPRDRADSDSAAAPADMSPPRESRQVLAISTAATRDLRGGEGGVPPVAAGGGEGVQCLLDRSRRPLVHSLRAPREGRRRRCSRC